MCKAHCEVEKAVGTVLCMGYGWFAGVRGGKACLQAVAEIYHGCELDCSHTACSEENANPLPVP